MLPRTRKLATILIIITLGLIVAELYFYRQRINQVEKRQSASILLDVSKSSPVRAQTAIKCVTLSTILLLLSSGRIHTQGDDYAWSWRCINDACVKSETPVKCNNDEIPELLDICRMTCGRYGAIWPQPSGEVRLSKDVVPVHPDFVTFDLKTLDEDNEVCTSNVLLKEMSQQFVEDMRTLCSDHCLPVTKMEFKIIVHTSSSNMNPTYDTDESYFLRVKTDGSKTVASIRAISIFGARHGLETLFQLMTNVPNNVTNYLVMVSDAMVRDRPTYSHRGLLIDTSRHYLQMNTIKRTLDAMGHSKLNVLHWHATDSHSFPLKLPRVPELARYGAYSSRKVYTVEDIKEIIEYARIRGVRIIMEIDSPAHAGNGWQWGPSSGLGELAVCINEPDWRTYCIQPPCGQLNPANPNVYSIIESLYRDLVDALPAETVFHMGGDELKFTCWNSTEEIVEYMQRMGLGRTEADFTQLWSLFHAKLLLILDQIRGHSEIPVILWSSHLTSPEAIESYLNKKRFIIQTWLPASENFMNTELLEKGYKVIISTKDAWYLDHGVWGTTKYHSSRTMYQNRIPSQTSGVLGGEVCMWGEYVDDSALDARVWPRAAAVAERLWADPETDFVNAQYRFLFHRERLVKMGIKAEAIVPEWCYLNENKCE